MQTWSHIVTNQTFSWKEVHSLCQFPAGPMDSDSTADKRKKWPSEENQIFRPLIREESSLVIRGESNLRIYRLSCEISFFFLVIAELFCDKHWIRCSWQDHHEISFFCLVTFCSYLVPFQIFMITAPQTHTHNVSLCALFSFNHV